MEKKICLKEQILQIAEQSFAFRKIGSYIESNWNKILYLSASQIAKNAGVSQGSVTRFCTELGYSGFAEFQRVLQQTPMDEITSVKRVQKLREVSDEIKELLDEEKSGINKLPEVLTQPDFDEIVNALIHSKKVILISGRISATILAILQYHLQKIRDNVVLVIPGDAQWDALETNSPEGCFVLAITFPRYYSLLIHKLEMLNEVGYTIGLLSDSILSPAIHFAKYHLELPIARKSIFDSYSLPVLFVNIMVMEVAKKIPDLESRMEQLEEIAKRDNTFCS